MAPDGWKKTIFKEGIELISGQHIETDQVNCLGYGEPYLTGPSDFSDGRILSTKFTENGKKFCAAGDLLVTVKGSGTGKVIESDRRYAISRQLMAVRPILFDQKFTYYCLSASINRYEDSAAGLIPGISREDILATPILVPPMPEQMKISKVLSTWDQAITTTEQLLENSRQQKMALMQRLLGSPESTERAGAMDFKRISDISERIQSKSDGGEYPVLTISSLSGFVRQDEKYSRFMAGKSVENYILLKKGEFAYNKGNSKTYEFGCVFDLDNFDAGLVPNVYVCFKLKPSFSHRYFKYLFEADYLKPQLGQLVNTGVRNNGLLNIKPSEFMNTKVPVPALNEQERIADILYTASMQISVIEQKLACLKQEKKALMQQLLTGKLRVKLDGQEGA